MVGKKEEKEDLIGLKSRDISRKEKAAWRKIIVRI